MPLPEYHIEENFDPTVIHSSSVQSLVECGIAFQMRYLERAPEETTGSAALRGLVIHRALEWWAPDRKADLAKLMDKAWEDYAEGTPLQAFLDEYRVLSRRARDVEQEIRDEWARNGKESKAPRLTKMWKESEVAGEINALCARFATVGGDRFRFTESDPLPAIYDETMALAPRYQLRWKHLPAPLHTEHRFKVAWRGFTLKGTVDVLELLKDRRTAGLCVAITDYKSDAVDPETAPLKHWRQLCMYDVAVKHAIETGELELPKEAHGVPIVVGVDYVRQFKRKYRQMDAADHDRLERELIAYREMVSRRLFLPAEKGRRPDFCAYPSRCCLRSATEAGGKATEVQLDV